jgi:succinate-semialdehyde dehydrogenase/glutarate-semialdehyde dehydrogenase
MEVPQMTEKIEKKAFIGGEWVESESGERFEVKYPGDGSVIGTAPLCTRKDAQKAIEAAKEGHEALMKLSLAARANLVLKALDLTKKRGEELARVCCLESGKTITEATSCAGAGGYSWSNFHIGAEVVKSYRGMTFPNTTEDSNNKRIITYRQPVGVAVNISTFSFPSEMPNCTVPYALALGNGVIVKPSRGGPFSCILTGEILQEAGFPPGSYNVVTGLGTEVGDELVSSPETGSVTFFGQSENGEAITRRAGIKKLLLALVSNNPLIVMDDANIEEAVNAAIGSAFGLSGQSPISTRRILVHKDVHRAFLDLLVEKTKALNLGEPLDEKTDVAPVNNEKVLEMALEHLEDAKTKGGKFLVGGNNPKGLYIDPTVIDEATEDMLVTTGPTPGPIAPIMTFGSLEKAVEMANGTKYGFQVGAFTSSLANAFCLGENIKAGAVYINESSSCWEEFAPFGGAKRSGLGRMLGHAVLDELTDMKLNLFDLGKVKK